MKEDVGTARRDVAGPASCGHDHARDHGHDHATCGHAHARVPLPLDSSALISARGLSLDRSGRTILQDIDIDLPQGEIVTLIGPNGAGKTSLVRLLLGLDTPSRGHIVRRGDLVVGYAPQRFDVDAALPMTVERFLRLGSSANRAAVLEALAEVGAARVVDSQLVALSGGEAQRVVLARALLRRPNLLVLDEPVRGVDNAGEAELYNLIGRLRGVRGFGVLLVSHDLHVVMAASDRVVCLNRHVCCSGVPTTVARHPEYMRLFGDDASRDLAVYEHHHDHAHDLTGAPLSEAGPGAPAADAGKA